MIKIEFWMGGKNTVCHDVSSDQVQACYALPKSADRFEYWRRITGDPAIVGPILIWSSHIQRRTK